MNRFNFPKEWKVDKNIPKEIIYNVADADDKLKRVFIDNVLRIRFMYALNFSNTNIEKFVEDNERYEEINFLQVDLKEIGKEQVISKLLHGLIPKGTVIILNYENKNMVSLASKRISENSIKIQEVYNSSWMDNNSEKLENFSYSNFNSRNLKFFYESIIEKVRVLNLSQEIGTSLEIEGDKVIRLEELSKEIEELKKLRKKETQMNRVVELQSRLVEKVKEQKRLLKEGVKKTL